MLGNFLTFQAESMRVLIGSFRQAKKEIADPQTMYRGIWRYGSILAYGTLRTMVNYWGAMAVQAGVDGILGMFTNSPEEDRKKDDLNRIAPEFSITGDKWTIYLGNGKYVIYDVTSADPYNWVSKAANAYTVKDEDGVAGGVMGVIKVILEPFFEEEMVFQTYGELKINRDAYGNHIYLENSDPEVMALDMLSYAWDKLKPGTFKSVDRLEKADEEGNTQNEVLAQLLGVRGYVVDLKTVFNRKLKESSSLMLDIMKEYDDVRFDKKATSGDKYRAWERASQHLNKEAMRLNLLYEAMIRLGADPEDMINTLEARGKARTGGWSPDFSYAIESGVQSEYMVEKPEEE
jgi:hypothetical protein